MSLVHSLNSWDRRITAIVHPDADGTPVHHDAFGGIRTEQGPAGYVLQNGERVTV